LLRNNLLRYFPAAGSNGEQREVKTSFHYLATLLFAAAGKKKTKSSQKLNMDFLFCSER